MSESRSFGWSCVRRPYIDTNIHAAYQKEPDVRKKPNKGTCQMDLTTISHLDSNQVDWIKVLK